MKCESLNITHLAFADDLIVLSRGDYESVHAVKECLKQFAECSGLQASVDKSCLFSAGVHGHDNDSLLEASGFQKRSMPFKYLGVPIAAARLSFVHFHPFLERFSSYLYSCLVQG